MSEDEVQLNSYKYCDISGINKNIYVKVASA